MGGVEYGDGVVFSSFRWFNWLTVSLLTKAKVAFWCAKGAWKVERIEVVSASTGDVRRDTKILAKMQIFTRDG